MLKIPFCILAALALAGAAWHIWQTLVWHWPRGPSFRDNVRCFFGRHDWTLGWVVRGRTALVGDRCKRCGRWGKNTIQATEPLDELPSQVYPKDW